MKRKTDLDYLAEQLIQDMEEGALLDSATPEADLAKMLEKRLPEHYKMPEGWNT